MKWGTLAVCSACGGHGVRSCIPGASCLKPGALCVHAVKCRFGKLFGLEATLRLAAETFQQDGPAGAVETAAEALGQWVSVLFVAVLDGVVRMEIGEEP